MDKLEEHEELRRRAALGEARAQLQLAWEYAKGEIVTKNIDTAIGLLREMESKAPQLARFNIAKKSDILKEITIHSLKNFDKTARLDLDPPSI
jgi:hypothetical protein